MNKSPDLPGITLCNVIVTPKMHAHIICFYYMQTAYVKSERCVEWNL